MRVARRLARKTVAAEAGIDVSYLAALERGSRNPPSPEKLEKILNCLGAQGKEREYLQAAALFSRVTNQDLQDAPAYLRDAVEIVKAIQQLTAPDIQLAKMLVQAIITNRTLMEAEM